MIEDLTEENIRTNCPHCDQESQAFKYPLAESQHFRLVCDAHPLEEGHILVIPKAHLSSIGQYNQEEFAEFSRIYEQAGNFVREKYGSVATFEHGKYGQTVFHSHVHLLPFGGKPEDVIPEGAEHLQPIDALEDLPEAYRRDGGYLFFSIGDQMWTVDVSLATPRFFRDRFAKALNHPERGNWKEVHVNPDRMADAKSENEATQQKWATAGLPSNF